MILEISAQQGTLQMLDTGILQMISPAQAVIWYVPHHSVNAFILRSHTRTTSLAVQTTYGTFIVDGITQQDIQRLQALFPNLPSTLVQHHQWKEVTRIAQQTTSALRASSVTQQPLTLTLGQFQPPVPSTTNASLGQWYKRQKRGTKLGIGCVSLLLLLTLCISVSTAASHTPTTTAVQSTSSPSPMPPHPTSTPPTQVTSTITSTQTPTPTPVPTDTPAPTPTPVPTDTPAPTPTPFPTATPVPATPTPTPQPTGVNGNPWGYDFTAGNLIYNPPADFCGTYFTCVTTFWTKTNGYVVACADGHYSHSGGVSGACSRNGGVQSPLYSH